MKVSFNKKSLNLLFFISTILVLLWPLYMYFSHDVENLNVKYPHIVRLSDNEVDYILKNGRPNNWIELKEISSYAKWAIIFSEDWAFYNHEGVDVNQMKLALTQMVSGNKFRGASTISQQLVKNVFLSNSRTVWRKIHEIILAQKMEKVLSKSRILEVYLNVIEFGPSIYGIKEASFHYFKKHPSLLTPRESAFLAMLLPSPKRYYESFRKKKLTIFAKKRVNNILEKLRMGKVITPERFTEEKSARFEWEG